jgi:hypothetical protein
LSFKSNVQWIKQITRFGGNQEFERLWQTREIAVG